MAKNAAVLPQQNLSAPRRPLAADERNTHKAFALPYADAVAIASIGEANPRRRVMVDRLEKTVRRFGALCMSLGTAGVLPIDIFRRHMLGKCPPIDKRPTLRERARRCATPALMDRGTLTSHLEEAYRLGILVLESGLLTMPHWLDANPDADELNRRIVAKRAAGARRKRAWAARQVGETFPPCVPKNEEISSSCETVTHRQETPLRELAPRSSPRRRFFPSQSPFASWPDRMPRRPSVAEIDAALDDIEATERRLAERATQQNLPGGQPVGPDPRGEKPDSLPEAQEGAGATSDTGMAAYFAARVEALLGRDRAELARTPRRVDRPDMRQVNESGPELKAAASPAPTRPQRATRQSAIVDGRNAPKTCPFPPYDAPATPAQIRDLSEGVLNGDWNVGAVLKLGAPYELARRAAEIARDKREAGRTIGNVGGFAYQTLINLQREAHGTVTRAPAPTQRAVG